MWASADPILDKYLDGAVNGVYESSNLALYTYARNNSVVLHDPDGNIVPLLYFAGAVIAGFIGDIKPANAPDRSGWTTRESVSLLPADLVKEEIKSVAPESTHTAIEVVSAIGNPKNAVKGAGDLIQNVKGRTREAGSYTNTHASGTTYDGYGGRKRSQESGRRVEAETGDQHIATDWTAAANRREGMKQESRRLDSHGGPTSNDNYNKIESPGKKYRAQDGD